MRSGTRLLIATAVGLLVIAGTAVAVAAQAAPQAQATPPAAATCPCGVGGMGAGWGGAFAAPNVLSEVLGMTPAEVAAERQSGKSLAQIAEAKGISKEDLVAKLLAAREEGLNELVTAGRITEEQKQLMLDNMKTQMTAMVESTTVGPMGQGRGMMGRWSEDGTVTPGQGLGPGRGRMGPGRWYQDGAQNQNQNFGPGMGRFGSGGNRT